MSDPIQQRAQAIVMQDNEGDPDPLQLEFITAIASALRAEIEECAGECDAKAKDYKKQGMDCAFGIAAASCAKAIRGRKETP